MRKVEGILGPVILGGSDISRLVYVSQSDQNTKKLNKRFLEYKSDMALVGHGVAETIDQKALDIAIASAIINPTEGEFLNSVVCVLRDAKKHFAAIPWLLADYLFLYSEPQATPRKSQLADDFRCRADEELAWIARFCFSQGLLTATAIAFHFIDNLEARDQLLEFFSRCDKT